MKPNACLYASILFGLSAGLAHAGPVDVPNAFAPNTPAIAAEVNGNYGAVEGAVDDNDARIAALEAAILAQQATIAALQNQVSAIWTGSLMDLDGLLVLMTDPATGQPTARFTGVNVQVINGTGSINTTNGLGNLIVGYNGGAGTVEFCSDGSYDTSQCVSNGGTLAADQRTGSHNVIVGNRNAYTSYGGLLAGSDSIINRKFVAVAGGRFNQASGEYSSVSGGYSNVAMDDSNEGTTAKHAVASGGMFNIASGIGTLVSGGEANIAYGDFSSIHGGQSNETSFNFGNFPALLASINGGESNDAFGPYSTVTGGLQNKAFGSSATISGGFDHRAFGQCTSISGGESNSTGSDPANSYGNFASVTGGKTNNTSADFAAVSGGLDAYADDVHNWIAGNLVEDY